MDSIDAPQIFEHLTV